MHIVRLILIRNLQHVQYEYPPLDETAAESSMGGGVGVVDGETGAGVSVIMGGASPPKLLTMLGLELGTKDGELSESNEINGDACWGERVVVVGGRVTAG